MGAIAAFVLRVIHGEREGAGMVFGAVVLVGEQAAFDLGLE